MQKFTNAFFGLRCTQANTHVPGKLLVKLGTPSDPLAVGGIGIKLGDRWYYDQHQTISAGLVLDGIAHAFGCMRAPNLIVSRTLKNTGMVFEDLASRDLTINFDYEGVANAAPAGLEVTVENHTGTVDTYSANYVPGPPISKIPTVNQGAIVKHGGYTAAIPACHNHNTECLKTCGSCAHYGLLDRRCQKSNDFGELKCDSECNNGLFEKA